MSKRIYVDVDGKPTKFKFVNMSTDLSETDLIRLAEAITKTTLKSFDFSTCGIRNFELYFSDWKQPYLYVWTQNITDRKKYYSHIGFVNNAFVHLPKPHISGLPRDGFFQIDIDIKEF